MRPSLLSRRGLCAGTLLVVAVSVHAAVLHVDANSANPVSPYTNWATAARVIQDAVDAAADGDIVLVTNGVYATGGRPGGRVVVDKPLTIRSVNGPQFTVIDGGSEVRCAFLTNDTSLSGFTLTNGLAYFAGIDGGGAYCFGPNVSLTNCVIVGNATGKSSSQLGSGGGAYGGTLYNCILSGNWSTNGGGATASTLYNCALSANIAFAAADQCTLYNCALTGNQFAASGSALYNCTLVSNSYGVAYSKLYNCILYDNTRWNYDSDPSLDSDLNYCCTTPMPSHGVGNITNAPLFVDLANGNFRLQSNSPCINAGKNSYLPNGTDLSGNPRIAGGTVDIGAYEYQSPASTISYAWLQQYGLPTDGSADNTDLDGDGHNNWQEWKAGTIPTNELSVLRLLNPVTNSFGLSVSWQSVADRTYFLERATNLGASPAFLLLRGNLPGQSGTTSYTDSNAVGSGPFFYRVGVQE